MSASAPLLPAASSSSGAQAKHPHSSRPLDAHVTDRAAGPKTRFCDNGYWGEYTGDLDARGLRHGHGECVFEDGYCYTGQWRDDVPDGTGTGRYPNGSEYAGKWREGQPALKLPNHAYIGQEATKGLKFVDGTIPGVYVGELSRGHRHGKGKMTYDNGTTFDGEWERNQKSGWGTAKYRKGGNYVGEWKAGSQHGWGTYTHSDGACYEGEWRFGSRDGRGTDRYPDGSKYVGAFRANRRNGRGTFHFADGRVQIGTFKDDVEHGIGVRWSADRKTAWLFKDGKPHKGVSLNEARDIASRMGFPAIN